MKHIYTASFCTFVLFSCSATPIQIEPNTPPVQHSSDASTTETSVQPVVVQETGICSGLMPFPREDRLFEQEIATLMLGTETDEQIYERADALARDKMLKRVCPGNTCPELKSKIIPWRRGRDGQKLCSSVLLPVDDLIAFEKKPLEDHKKRETHFSDEMKQITKKVLASLPDRKVELDSVSLKCVQGGYIANWLLDRIAMTLNTHEVNTQFVSSHHQRSVDIPRLSGAIQERKTAEGEDGYEVFWKLEYKNNTRTIASMRFARSIAPREVVEQECTSSIPEEDTLSLHFEDTIMGGALCAGQTSRMFVNSSKEGHVRVISLSMDRSQGILSFPEQPSSSDVIKANQPRMLGEEPFIIVPFDPKQSTEAYIVMRASEREDLGMLAKAQQSCKLTREELEDIEKLAKTSSEVTVHSSVFRLISGPLCAAYDTAELRAMQKQVPEALENLPYCHDL